jgi:ornithine cyclodeaminase
MSTEVLCLSADEVDRLLDIDTAIDSQRAAFASLARGTTSPAEKIMVPGGPDGSVAVCYAARLSTETGPVCKFVSVNPANARLGLPSISGVLMALDPETGRPVAIMDGAIVTAVRTAAASAAVADALATAQSTELAVLDPGCRGVVMCTPSAGCVPSVKSACGVGLRRGGTASRASWRASSDSPSSRAPAPRRRCAMQTSSRRAR